MANRRTEKAALKNKQLRWKKQGKLTSAQIESDKLKDHGMYVGLGNSMPEVEPLLDKSFVPHKTKEARKYVTSHTGRSPGRIFRGKNDSIFVARDLLDEYFLTTFRLHKYSEEELLNLGQPNEEGWRTAEPVPLAEVKKKLKELQSGIEKWRHFNVVRTEHTVIDLFFSPKKDLCFYVEISPLSGLCRRSEFLPDKMMAEFRRKVKSIRWYPLNPKNPLVF